MDRFITLPDHISFEELAQKWCDYGDGFSCAALEYDSGEWEFVLFADEQRFLYFIFDTKSRELENDGQRGDDPEKHILDYIKERSNG